MDPRMVAVVKKQRIQDFLFHKVTIDTLRDKKTVDEIKEMVLINYKTEMLKRPSFHKYIFTLPEAGRVAAK